VGSDNEALLPVTRAPAIRSRKVTATVKRASLGIHGFVVTEAMRSVCPDKIALFEERVMVWAR
jgi:hypothetical protein